MSKVIRTLCRDLKQNVNNMYKSESNCKKFRSFNYKQKRMAILTKISQLKRIKKMVDIYRCIFHLLF